MKIIFRTDTSFQIGTGHVVRCLTLADKLREQGAEVEFICREIEDMQARLVESKGFKLYKLAASIGVNENYCAHSTWLKAPWMEDAAQTAAIAKGADWLVIDHYALDSKWEKALRPFVQKIMVIDDIADRSHDCDLLLDQNYYTDMATRYDTLAPNAKKLLGPEFAVLRDEFALAREKLERSFSNVHNIFIFFGGVDANNDTASALKGLKGFDGRVVVVAGGANRNFAELEKFAAENGNITLFRTAPNIAELMSKSDLAIGAGGSTSWERASLGLPTLCWPIADNQVRILNDLASAGVVKISSPEKLIGDINSFNQKTLETMSARALALCDAKGAARVAKAIYEN